MRALGVFFLVLLTVAGSACATETQSDYDRVASLYGDAVCYAGTDYDEFAKLLDSAESSATAFLSIHAEDDARPAVEKILGDVKTRKVAVERERTDYTSLARKFKKKHSTATLDAEIAAIDAFLRKYPDAVTRTGLETRVQDLVFKAVSLTTEDKPSSVAELDKQLAACRKYAERVTDPARRDEIQKRIASLEALRTGIFDREVARAAEELFAEMEDTAHEMAMDEHPFSEVDRIETVTTEKQERDSGRFEYTRVLAVSMRGSLAGVTRHRLLVRMTGVVATDPKTGAKFELTGAKITEDNRSSAFRERLRLLRASL